MTRGRCFSFLLAAGREGAELPVGRTEAAGGCETGSDGGRRAGGNGGAGAGGGPRCGGGTGTGTGTERTWGGGSGGRRGPSLKDSWGWESVGPGLQGL